jgi:hypothetical protein
MSVSVRTALCVLLGAAAADAAPVLNLCDKGEIVAFSCEFKNKKVVSLCVAEKKHLRYRFGTPDKVESTYPEEGKKGAFTHHSYTGNGRAGTQDVSFTSAAYVYTIQHEWWLPDIDAAVNPRARGMGESYTLTAAKGDKTLFNKQCTAKVTPFHDILDTLLPPTSE